MRGHDELIRRLAIRRREELGDMSDEAFAELEEAVRKNPTSFTQDARDQAFAEVVEGIDALEASRADDDLLDDDQYEATRARRLERLGSTCARALELDPTCLDARLLQTLALDQDADATLRRLLELGHEVESLESDGTDLWEDVFARPRMRLMGAVARLSLESARYGAAREACHRLVELSAADPLGARFTWALACARLEDEEGFNELDAKVGRRGNAWSHLARTLLMFKLDRTGAARRALRGFASLCEGGAYALLRPIYIDTYLPDRPLAMGGSFEEVTLAVHEADPIIVDTPDFVAWAAAQEGMAEQAERYANEKGFDW